MDKQKLEKIILKYTGVAGALLGVQAADGQIVDSIAWTDIKDTTLSKNGALYNINMDQDTSGIIDFRINLFIDSTVYDFTGVTIEQRGNAGNQVAGINYSLYNYPFKLNVGDSVGGSTTFKGINTAKNVGYMALAVGDTTYPNSEWVGGVTDGFLGVRFRGLQNDTVRTFYGWIRLDVASDLRSVTIKDFAYRTAADSTITMGQGSPIGIEENKFTAERPSLYQRGSFLDVEIPATYNDSEAELVIIDLTGKEIKRQKLSGYKNTIELNDISKGVHIATVTSNGVEASRKIVVY